MVLLLILVMFVKSNVALHMDFIGNLFNKIDLSKSLNCFYMGRGVIVALDSLKV